MESKEILGAFTPLLADMNDIETLRKNRPLLAHYTSMETLEKIMRSDELWFSNPLFMNDHEEMRFGVIEGVRMFENSEAVVEAAGSKERAERLRRDLFHYFTEFDTKHAFDIYVFCLSEHDPKQTDGLLSMWRGYGGSGSGAALVFNTRLITEERSESPLYIVKVRYASTEERRLQLSEMLNRWCEIIAKLNLADEQLYLAAFSFLNILRFFALISKHNGFGEEKEWRVIYMADHDPAGVFKNSLNYAVTRRGLEPKLQLKLAPVSPGEKDIWNFEKILDRIILGPSASSMLAQLSVKRMLERCGKPDFCEKVHPSSIPLRPA